MKVGIGNIPDEGVRFGFSRKGKWLESMLPADKRRDFSLREVHVDCLAMKIRETVRLEMSIHMALELECSRCLEGLVLPIDAEVKFTLAPLRERMEGDAPESLEEDLNFGYYKDDEIDFDEIVLDQVIMQVPFKPLCADQCRGLCPNCGMNLNTGSCSCRKQTGHAGFAPLRNFVVQK